MGSGPCPLVFVLMQLSVPYNTTAHGGVKSATPRVICMRMIVGTSSLRASSLLVQYRQHVCRPAPTQQQTAKFTLSSSHRQWPGKFRKPQHVEKAAKMSWMDSWSRPSKSQATPAPFYLLPGGESTPYCKTCGRVIGL